MIKLSQHELETQKEDIRVQAFNDELVKISAYQILGPDVDLNNLTPEQMEKLAQWKFPLLRGLGKATRKVVEGGKKAGKYLGEKGKDLVEGVGQVAKGAVNIAKVPASMGLDATKAVAGGVGAAVTGAAAAAKEGYESGAPKPKETKPAETKPAETKPAETKPAETPKTEGSSLGLDGALGEAAKKVTSEAGLPVVKEEASKKTMQDMPAAAAKAALGAIPGVGTAAKAGIDAVTKKEEPAKAPEPEKMKANPNSGNIPSKQTAFERNNPPKKAKEMTFGQAFAANRKAGKDTFEWRGKKYTTEMA
tara:strand:+ start:2457 stop:3374 length:918 start_codon:yes stop_codon:yes gene_type:complete